ncbi:hypothetical protein HY498_00070 [Candidatus Woesearchaeota archaeon]|nr:hypothetical protein [Candidatus Woesearchaeota archaeon]
MEYLAKGKRSKVYLIIKNNKKFVKKFSNESYIQNEVKWLKFLNKYNIGPKLISFDNESLTEEYIEGEIIEDFLKRAKKSEIKTVLKKILQQCYILDKLKVNKFELTNPYKHIIIKNLNPIMIDFERCRFSLKPKNVSQFVEYILRLNIFDIDKYKIRNLVKKYKKSYSLKSYKEILKHIK